ncbi:MAG: DUF4412 domain-containing protein [Chitinophagaceae bacterium]|nr:MAG: DUF4412 domain-containing protein [Chitinophagaceae bacterium]
MTIILPLLKVQLATNKKYFMKKSILTFWCVLMASVQLFAFEGVIKLKMENKELNEIATVEWYIKGGSHAMYFNSQMEDGAYAYKMIIKEGKSEMIMVSEVEGETNITRIPLSALNAEHGGWALAEISKTGKTLEMAGKEAQNYRIKSSEAIANCWIADIEELKDINLPVVFSSGGLLMLLENNNISGFPMKLEVYDANAQRLYYQEITSIENKEVSVSKFATPR